MKTLEPSIPILGSTLQTLQIRGPGGAWRAGKTSSTQRGYGYAWQKARAAFLLEHPLCVMCAANGRGSPATVVDHRVPHRGDMVIFWDKSNWQPLCRPHHDGHKKAQDAAAARA